MGAIFKKVIENKFFNEIHDNLTNEMRNNHYMHDLTKRARGVCEVTEAELDTMDILDINNIEQDDAVVEFDILVKCNIDIEDKTFGESFQETICQWFNVNCSAILEDVNLNNFQIHDVMTFNK